MTVQVHAGRTERAPEESTGFWAFAHRHPDKPAVIEVDGVTLTFGELAGRVNRLSHVLRDAGLGPGDHLAFMLPNGSVVYEVLLACVQIGVIVTPINHHLREDEIAYILGDSDARAFVTHPDVGAEARAAADAAGLGAGSRLAFGPLDGFRDLRPLMGAAPATLPVDRRAGDTMLYTSGTTGRPKGVLRVASPRDMEGALRKTVSLATGRGASEAGVHLVQGPLYHAGPQRTSYWALHVGATVVVMGKWDAEQCLALIARHRVTESFMVATMLHRLLRLPPEGRERFDVSSLRTDGIVLGAASCPAATKRAMIDWWGPVFLESYGGTEGNVAMITSREWAEHPGSVGRPTPGITVAVYDEDRRPCPPGVVGTIYGRIDGLVGFGTEYYKDPAKTEAARIGDMMTLGDLGYVDADGWIYVVDRRVDLVISGGVNIYPAEVEEVLFRHPAVADVAVIGVPSPEWGQEVKAFVQPAEAVVPTDALGAELIAFVRQHLASFKAPRHVEFRTELPRYPSGKLFKRRLLEEAWAGAAGAPADGGAGGA